VILLEETTKLLAVITHTL